MATSVGSLAVGLSLDTSQFKREISSAEREMSRFRGAIAKSAQADLGVTTTAASMRKNIAREMGITTTRADRMEAVRAQFQNVSGRLAEDPTYNSMNGIRTMSAKEAGAISEDVSIKKQLQGFEMVGKAMIGIQVATTATKAITAAMRKDWTGVQEAVNQLPYGIGQAAEAVADLKAQFTGAKREVEALNEKAKQMDLVTADRRKFADTLKGVKEAGAARMRDMKAEYGALGRVGLDAQIFGINTQEASSIDALQQEKRDKMKSLGLDMTSKEALTIGAEYDKQIAMQRELAASKRHQAQIDFDNQEIGEVRRAEAEINALRLETTDDGIQAQIERIKEGGKLTAQAERDAGRFRMAAITDALTEAQVEKFKHEQFTDASNKLADMKAQNIASIINGQNNPMATAFAMPAAYVDPKQLRQAEAEKATSAQQARMVKLLEEIVKNTQDSGVRVGNQ